MRIDIRSNDGWTEVCEQYRQALPEALRDPNLNVQVYQGYEHALREVSASVARLFSHKRTIAVATRHEPALERLAQAFSAEGFTIQNLEESALQDVSSWLPAMQNDLLFIAYAKDDPVTGRVHDLAAFEKAVQSARVTRIALSHAVFKQEELKRPLPFEIQILSLSPSRALMLAGERGKVRPQTADVLDWPKESDDVVKSNLSILDAAEGDARRVKIETFEKSLSPGFSRVFSPGDARILDRAVFFHEGLDGSALIAELASGAGATATFDTTSPCRWENPRLAEWLISRGLKPNQIRGLVVCDVEAITPEFAKELGRAADRILQMQS